jgi:hypothetical protein
VKTPDRKKIKENATLADHAEAWAVETGQSVPDRGSKAWDEFYTRWIVYAFDSPKELEDAEEENKL